MSKKLYGALRPRWATGMVLVTLLAQGGTAFGQNVGPTDNSVETEGQEIIVTATRTSEALSKVPISVLVLSREKLDQTGIKKFSDVIRFTPGLTLNEGISGSNNISIRGISSSAGASTTGIYIDDVPIQVRQIGYSAASSFPVIFDLDRIEVLRGPQGTLFGAGSEGGTVRFIQPNPSTTDWSVYGRAEGSITPHAEGSYEAGIALGGPISDKVGFRASAFYRYDGGWIDKVPATLTLLDPTAEEGPASVGFTQNGPGERNYNNAKTLALRGALRFEPTETLSITPSIFYQDEKMGAPPTGFWLSGSDPGAHRFVVPDFDPGAPSVADGLTALSLPDTEKGRATLLVGAIGLQWDLDGLSIYSTSSYLRQKRHQYTDFTIGYEINYMGQEFAAPGAKGVSLAKDVQRNFTQELRLQSNDPDARLKWVIGAFYTRSRQTSDQLIEENAFFHADSFFGIPNLDNEAPFGPGFNNTQNIWGAPMLGDSGTYGAFAASRERQLAGFGQLDFKLTDRLTVTAGARVSKNWLRYSLVGSGPENNLNAPFGAPCPTGATCPFGSGVFAPSYPTGTVRNVEEAFTPKVGLSFQADPKNLFYASASKGFRPGGGQIPLPSACAADLASFGYVDSNGNAFTPPVYKSDSVWSYEVGSKNRLFGNLMSVAASGYIIKWKNIQTSLFLPTCGYALIDNLGSATVKGFDLSVDIRPAPGLTMNAAVGYSDASLDDALTSPDGNVILSKGSAIGNSGPPWRVVLSAQYETGLSKDLNGYVRGDVTYSSRERGNGVTDPRTFNFDPLLQTNEASTVVNARIGGVMKGIDASLFVNNLFDTTPLSDYSRTRYVFSARTIRPRTFGITIAVRR